MLKKRLKREISDKGWCIGLEAWGGSVHWFLEKIRGCVGGFLSKNERAAGLVMAVYRGK